MNLTDALNLLEITDIQSLTRQELKLKYRKKIKQFHPDSPNGSAEMSANIISANEIISDALAEIESYNAIMRALEKSTHCITAVIPLQKLIDIYSGESITLGKGSNTEVLSMSNLMKHNVFAVIDFSVSIMNEDTQHFNKICRVEMMRKYELVCDLLVKDLSTINIVVNMLGVRKKFEMSLSNLQFIMKLDNDINVQITLRKKIKTEN